MILIITVCIYSWQSEPFQVYAAAKGTGCGGRALFVIEREKKPGVILSNKSRRPAKLLVTTPFSNKCRVPISNAKQQLPITAYDGRRDKPTCEVPSCSFYRPPVSYSPFFVLHLPHLSGRWRPRGLCTCSWRGLEAFVFARSSPGRPLGRRPVLYTLSGT